MNKEPLTYTQTIERKIVDRNGVPIHVGSVIRNITDGARGVVSAIALPGVAVIRAFPMDAVVGELDIRLQPGGTRITNCYSEWEHIPHAEQTYWERYDSWVHRPYEHDPEWGVEEEEGLAVTGIVALLPHDVFAEAEESAAFPTTLEEALRLMVEHLESLDPHHRVRPGCRVRLDTRGGYQAKQGGTVTRVFMLEGEEWAHIDWGGAPTHLNNLPIQTKNLIVTDASSEDVPPTGNTTETTKKK